MAKRFTETNKWDKPWFRKLGSQGRDIWNWLHDRCEAAGIWEIDLDRMSFELGFEITLPKVLEVMKGAKEIGDNKLFFPGFIQFQYGHLSDDCKPHQPIIRRLKSLNLWKGYVKGLQTLEEKEKEKETEKDKEKDPQKLSPTHLFDLWNKNRGSLPKADDFTDPRKEKARAQLKKYPDPTHWLMALEKFKRSDFCLNEWRPGIDDWLNENKRIPAIEGKYDNKKPTAAKVVL